LSHPSFVSSRQIVAAKGPYCQVSQAQLEPAEPAIPRRSPKAPATAGAFPHKAGLVRLDRIAKPPEIFIFLNIVKDRGLNEKIRLFGVNIISL
jgi:hypothetical protein